MRSRYALFALALLIACSDSPEPEPEAHGGDGALYLAAARIWDLDDGPTTSYLHVLPSIERGTEVDMSQAREVSGAAKLFAYGKDNWFAVGSGEEPTITRYTLDRQGRLKQGDAISLQAYGVRDLWDALYFVSPELAYYPDTTGSQLIRWNPSTMEVLGTTELPDTVREGYLSYYSLTAVVRGDKLLFSVGWFDWEANDTILGETGLVEFDTKNHEVSRYEVDSRCGGITQAVEASSGDTYFVSSALAAATYRMGRLTTEPCALRVRKGTSNFDANYLTHLKALTGGSLAGEPVPVGDDVVMLRVLDESKAEVKDDAMTWDLTGQAAWTWSRWKLGEDEATPVEEMPASTADTFWFRVDGDVYASETNPDYTETTLVKLSAESALKRELTVPGFLQNIARIR